MTQQELIEKLKGGAIIVETHPPRKSVYYKLDSGETVSTSQYKKLWGSGLIEKTHFRSAVNIIWHNKWADNKH